MCGAARRSLYLVLLVALVVAGEVALAWWSVAGFVFVTLAALLGRGVGWSLGYHHALAQVEQARQAPPTRRRRTQTQATKRKARQ